MSDAGFEAALPLIIELIQWCEANAQRQTITARELGVALGRTNKELYRVFDELGLAPRTWEEPDDYAVADVLEACTRHEVAARSN